MDKNKITLTNNHKGWILSLKKDTNCQVALLGSKWSYAVDYSPNGTFTDDKSFKDTDGLIILFDGVIFEKNQLVNYGEDVHSAISKLYSEYGDTFPDKINGSFSGFIIDKIRNRVVVFSDHIGSKAVFYAKYKDCIIFSSDIASIYDNIETQGLSKTLDVSSAYSLLGNGYMFGNSTLVDEVKRMLPGNVIVIDDGFKESPYYIIDNTPDYTLSELDAVELVDSLFKRAVKAQYDSDLRGRVNTHLVALSGGLDSRMTSLVAHELGYTSQLNYTVSKSGYLDQSIAQEIACDYNHDWVFKSLDTGSYLLDFENIIEYTGGYELYYGTAHVQSLISMIDLSHFGIVHSGMLGDVIIGTYYNGVNPDRKFNLGCGAFYPNKLLSKVHFTKLDYANEEIGIFYNRGINGMLFAAHTLVQQQLETFAPFIFRPFFDAMLKIPLKYRWNHNLYKKWILSKHPDAAKYRWERIRARINEPTISILGRTVAVSNIPDVIKRKILRQQGGADYAFQMTPIGWSLKRNEILRRSLLNYMDNTLEVIDNPELRADSAELMQNGDVYDHNKLIALLAAMKRFDIK